jgi:hypothetical protein
MPAPVAKPPASPPARPAQTHPDQTVAKKRKAARRRDVRIPITRTPEKPMPENPVRNSPLGKVCKQSPLSTQRQDKDARNTQHWHHPAIMEDSHGKTHEETHEEKQGWPGRTDSRIDKALEPCIQFLNTIWLGGTIYHPGAGLPKYCQKRCFLLHFVAQTCKSLLVLNY